MVKSYTQDSLGTRIKRYEATSQSKLTPRTPVILRVDGKAFHTWTKRVDCVRPYDITLIESMIEAARWTANELFGFKLGYVQSDEATFLITDYDALDTPGWFDYNVNKLVSVTASLFTARFNQVYYSLRSVSDNPRIFGPYDLAHFDCRAFNVPENDVANVFLWRQQDWVRNSVQMLAQSQFFHKELHGKKQADLHEMLHEKGISWADQPNVIKNGTYILGGFSHRSDVLPVYADIERLLDEQFGRTL